MAAFSVYENDAQEGTMHGKAGDKDGRKEGHTRLGD
jgi:hypothetical protein